jgi:uncharacterized protein (DUF885 family)
VQVETDLYIVLPAQGLGYKLGQFEIKRLRVQAQTQSGSHYDVRAFPEILNGDALPLDLMDEHVNGWITSQKNGETKASAATK